MKRLVLSGAPLLKKLIEALRGATAAVFNTFIFNSVRGATSPEALDDKRVAETFILRIDTYRTAMSNYVTLLKELELSVDQLMTAFVQPRSAVSIAAFAQPSGELLARAEAWRRAYLRLGAGGY